MTMTTTTRTDAQLTAVAVALDAQRAHVLGAIDDLTEDQLRRPMLPSGWNCLDLLHHLTRDVEHFWFRAVIAGEPEAIEASLTGDDGWHPDASRSAADIVADYRQRIELSDATLAGRSWGDAPAWWPPFFGDYRLDTVGEVLLHVLTETACHAGHLDATRELIDGRQWLTFD